MKLTHLLCRACGHRWIPRSNRLPAVCPKRTCRSRAWADKPQKVKARA
jgi:ribosomal protein L37E